MNTAWATDIHLNFISQAQAQAFSQRINDSGADAVLIGGDIVESDSLVAWLQFLGNYLQQPVYFVLGNHDFYGSDIATVRQLAASLKDNPQWLPHTGVVRLTADTGLVGHDGWADARIGDFMNSPVLLNDYFQIEDLSVAAKGGKAALKAKLGELGDQAAAGLRPYLMKALNRYPNVIVLTHVPPFRDACWHEGQISDDNWLPGFTCKAMGDMLLEVVGKHPQCQITVLCGHTHGEGEAQLLPNLKVYTGAAEYGYPDFKLLDSATVF